VKFNVDSYRMAEKKASELAANKDLDKIRAAVLGKSSPLAAALDAYDLKALQAAKIDYKKAVETVTSNSTIDFAFNKAILGM
jgi:hypothetical protein